MNKDDIIINNTVINTQSKIYGLTGIQNLGNTCYMNSAIQALAHNHVLMNYMFNNKNEIFKILLKNARNILKDSEKFQLSEVNSIPLSLKKKIQDPQYNFTMLDNNEINIILNNTITVQLIRLLEYMWKDNCIVIPTSFRVIFTEARNKFFFGNEHHDAEEAYTCIVQKIMEELAEKKNIKFRMQNEDVMSLIQFTQNMREEILKAKDATERDRLSKLYHTKISEMPREILMINSYSTMKKYYGENYSHVMEMFTGFQHSSLNCPNNQCGYISNKFDPFTHLSLPLPSNMTHIDECLQEYFKEEVLDSDNSWTCDKCKNNVRAIKKLALWTLPHILVIQLKRFNIYRQSKDNRTVNFPTDDFDLSKYISTNQLEPINNSKYKLQCIINHTGGLNHGHYFTYNLDMNMDKWYIFNDDVVAPISHNRVITSSAYLLFYVRQDLLSS
ncbi:putative ubiquitin carboxyl-terminal hydrolase [Moumouvirus australiensis]|uniref:Putative ubiquitin carboxyl-terminal hydrolase n=1 Tax=Moumouvirus australiensis TaxID=2109587 RepID=A0A2P1ELX0_9VIRU|nr:putative ubiquitin carboxyl-terminal hydrolase [Moumouvirus australiensis]AVL94896.1 putative ubiquitin carboxyl-terminal hydrolase [Moumouvirus australiensis]